MNNTNNNLLKIISANVNSVQSNERRHNVVQWIQKEDPDLVLLNETKLKPSHKPKFKNYNMIRNDRISSNGGGVALLIKKRIKYEQITLNTRLEILEIVVAKIRLQSGNNLFIITAYAPGIESNVFVAELEYIFKSLALDSPNNFFVLAGDLNAKHTSWNNPYNNGRGLALFNWIADNDIEYKTVLRSTNVMTFPRSNAYIDIGLVDSRLHIGNLNPDGTVQTLDIDSDHRAICILCALPNTEDQIVFSVPHRIINYNKTDWEAFQQEIVNNNNISIPQTRNLKNTEIDKYLEDLNNVITKAIDKKIPKFQDNNSTDSYINPRIKQLLKTKSKLITILNNEYRHPSA